MLLKYKQKTTNNYELIQMLLDIMVLIIGDNKYNCFNSKKYENKFL